MSLKAVLFDLDGTLLDYDLRTEFLPNYFKSLGEYFAYLIPPDKLISGIQLGSEAITNNDGTMTNAQAFASVFYPYVNMERESLEPLFLEFYKSVFPTLRKYTKRKPKARDAVLTAFEKGYSVAIATNPYFPEIAVRERLSWADIDNFPYKKISTYENSHFAKPDPRYYLEILDDIGCKPEASLMVGDETMDIIAGTIGCQTFLVTSPATVNEKLVITPTYCGTLSDVIHLLESS